MSRAAATTQVAHVGGHDVAITHPDKVLWPEDGITKAAYVLYMHQVAPYLLPYLADRPLTLERYPSGIAGPSFFEKNAPRGTPDWVRTVTLPSDGGKRAETTYIVCDDEATLLWCANLGAITLHVWMSRISALDTPEDALFDLDPDDGATSKTLAEVALAIREEIGALGLEALAKTSGGSGLHVVVPLAPKHDYAQVKAFVGAVAHAVAARMPAQVTLERTVARRPKGTIYLDWMQVGKGKTIVPPFVVRARPKGPVSWPIDWDEIASLARKRGKPFEDEAARFTIANVPRLLEKNGDPWKDALRRLGGPRGQRLDRALEAGKKRGR